MNTPQPNLPEQEIHLRDYLRVIRKRRKTILSFLILTVLTVVIATTTTTPIFTASSQVLIERNTNSNGIDRNTPYLRYDPEFLSTQYELIRSANVARRVVEKLHLDTRYRHYFFTEEQGGIMGFVSSSLQGLKHSIGELLRRSDVIDGAAPPKGEELLGDNDAITDADLITSLIQRNLTIKPVTNTKTVYIRYSDKNPAMAKLIANSIVQAYMSEMLEIKLASSNYSLQWMTSKADEERKKLATSELSLQKYMRDNDLVTVENKLAVFPQRLAEFSSQLSKAQAEQKEYQSLYAQIKGLGEDYKNIETIPVFAENKILQKLREKVFAAEQKIKDLSKKYGYKHPVMINAKAERALLLQEKQFEINRIIEATKNANDLARSRENNLKQLLSSTKQEILNINERFTQYSIMKRGVDMNRVLYDALTSSIKTAGVTEQSQDVRIWVVKKADLPLHPSKPNKKRDLALGLVLGLFGGIGLAFFIEYLDNTVKTGEDIEQRFGISVLGSVEELHGKDNDMDTYLLEHPLSPLAESYRLIRTALLLASADRPPRTILLTSMEPKEGKTTSTCNLARILAQNGKKVLIIDCDMRRPRATSLFKIPQSNGLSDYLAGHTDHSLIRTIPGEPLSLITSGPTPPNPAELLQSNRMERLLSEMIKVYDFVLLDSPPVQRVADSLTLSGLVDGVLLVTKSGQTTYDALESGIKKLRSSHAPILGFIVNGLVMDKQNSASFGYYQEYTLDTQEERRPQR